MRLPLDQPHGQSSVATWPVAMLTGSTGLLGPPGVLRPQLGPQDPQLPPWPAFSFLWLEFIKQGHTDDLNWSLYKRLLFFSDVPLAP